MQASNGRGPAPSGDSSSSPSSREGAYYVCPGCGYKQKSQAENYIRCHRCKKQYKRRTAKKERKIPDREKGVGFFQYAVEE